MDTGDAQVGGRSCVEKIWTSVEGVLGQEEDAASRKDIVRWTTGRVCGAGKD